MATKICSCCKKELDISSFHKDKSRKDGLSRCCKECRKLRSSVYYKANTEKIKAKNKAWQDTNPDKFKEILESYQKANPEKMKALWKRGREKISQSYVAMIIGIPVSELPDSIYQTKKLLLQIKRTIKNQTL